MNRRMNCRKAFLAALLIPGLVYAETATEEVQPVLEEVLVTAQRRGPERLQDIPMSVSVIDSESIRRNGMVEMNDYLRALPSVSYVETGALNNNVIIRGLATNFWWDSTTGIYFGDTPVTRLGTRYVGAPDLKLVDIERIEVLRGPQGTLYGEGSMGGTVRIIPAPPNPAKIDSLVTGSFSVTGAEGGDNSTLEGVLNLPFLDGEAALRLVAYRHENSGYYRNVAGSDPESRYWSEYFGVSAIDKGDMGATTYTGWRAQLLWNPKPELSIKLMALSQEVDQDGRAEGHAGLQEFHQAILSKLNGDGDKFFIDFDLGNLEISYDFEAFSLLSTTSLVESRSDRDALIPWTVDGSSFYQMPLYNRYPGLARSFDQELRLTSRPDKRLRYLAGLFYQDIDSSLDNIFTYEGDPAVDPWGGAKILHGIGEFDEKQTALFGELSYDVTDRFTGSVGARWFSYDQKLLWTGGGVWAGADDTYLPSSASDDGQTYSWKLEYAAGESTRIYGSFNQGFRFGGPAENLPASCDENGDGLIDGTDLSMTANIDSDTMDSYELGVRYRSSDGRFAVNATVFFVDWTDIPVRVDIPCLFVKTANAGRAESRGIEIEGAWEIAEGLVFNYGASWMDPKLTEDSGSLGQAGDRLPGSPRHNLNLGIEQAFRMGQRDAFVRADLVNVGEYYDNLQQLGQASGGYTTIGARAGVSLDDWLIELYVHNLTDEFAVTYFDWLYEMYYVLRPRTVGVQLSYQFSGQ